MKIRPRNIPKFLGGNKFWYSNISSYDPTNYTWDYDTLAGLKKGDVRGGFKSPWASPTAGLDPGRYTPTDLSPEYGTMGLGLSHYTYTLGVEALPYYKEFTEALFDKDNKVTPVGMEYIKLSDALLPEGHNARILNPDGTIKNKITVTLKDAHRRSPQIRTFNLKNPEELKAYIEHVRNDLTVGGRHNVFPKVGKRYYYYDNEGNTHWVNPEEAKNYEMFETPDEGFDDKSGVYWYDYQLKGPKKPGTPNGTPTSNRVSTSNGTASITGEHIEKESVWPKILEQLRKYGPNLLAAGRLAGNLWNNERVFKESLAAIKPNLKGTYRTERQVVGDEATKQGFYRRAALGLTAAARPFTSDADRQTAYLMEAKRVGDELRALGDLADNQEIRRTSDESNQHQWANTLRATEVANANIEAMNYADALKHNLKALKYSADWTSIDNELLAKETRGLLKLARSENILNQIFALDEQLRISNDLEYNLLYDTMQEAWALALKDNNNDATKARLDPNFKEALKQFNYKNYLLKRESYLRMLNSPYYAKEGLKFSFKSNDSLLYKTTRDAVQHFLKMSKIASDSYNRKPVKILKLTSHPKGNTRKYLLGGAAPFTVYRPATLGGDSTMVSQTGTTNTSNSKSSSSSKGNDTLDMVKELFKLVAGKGLPSDVNSLYQSMLNFLTRASVFGQEISTEDIASMYLSQMQQLNLIQYLKANFDKAKDIAINNDALNEVAIDSAGRIAVLDIKNPGEIKFVKSLEEALKNNYTVLTNELLLNYRALIPLFAARTDLDGVVSNGVGLNKIAQYIKSIKPQLGTEELTKEGFTKVLAGKIQAGFELLQSAPDGDYKYTDYTKDLLEQMLLALQYISSVLPTNMRAVIQFHADLDRTTPNKILGSLLGSELNLEHKRTYSPMTGKAAKDSSGNGKSGSGENDIVPAIAFFNGLGEKETFIILDKTQDGLKINTISAPITLKGYNTGSITFDKLQTSDFGGQLNINQATMGDTLISSTGRQNIIIDGRIYQAELPIDQNAKNNEGIVKPDLRFLKNIEAADIELRNLGIDKSNPNNISKINEVYKKHNLPVLYTISNNKLTITSNYARFAIVNGIGTEEAFNENPEFNDAIQEITESKERDSFESLMQQLQGNSKYKLNNGYGIGPISWGETKLYKGTIYIPMVNSNISALGGTGYKAKGEEYNLIEAQQLAADAARQMGFNPAGDASNL